MTASASAPAGLSDAARALLSERAANRRHDAIPPRPDRATAPLSFVQQRIWLYEQLEPESTAYHSPVALRVDGALDPFALERALRVIIARHEILRTTFTAGADGIPSQHVSPEPRVEFVSEAVGDGANGWLRAERRMHEEGRRPFDLATEPPIRARLFGVAPELHLFLVVFHHIACDGWSVGVFLGELDQAYRAEAAGQALLLEPPAVQYGDYAHWQRERMQDATLARELAHWTTAIGGADTMLALPTAFPRTIDQSPAAGRVTATLDPALTARLREVGRTEGATLFMTLAAGLQVLLARYTGQQDFLIGIPVAGRERREIERCLGCFINTLALRCDLAGSPSFRELVRRVRKAVAEGLAHQSLPFEQLVEAVQPARDRQAAPLVQVLLNFRNLPPVAPALGEAAVTRLDYRGEATMVDLDFEITETAAGLECTLVYAASLFDREAVARLLSHLERLLRAAVDEPDSAAMRLPLLAAPERDELLGPLAGMTAPLPGQACIHHLIADRAATAPDSIAVTGEGRELTYADLLSRAEVVAEALRNQGIGRGSRVGLAVPRSPDLIAGMVGIMTAGAAYVPLDPDFPDDRLAFMVTDASLGCIVVTRAGRERFAAVTSVPMVALDELPAGPAAGWSPGPATPEDAAYVIYTSGSTGTPKGVVIGHRALVAFTFGTLGNYELSPSDRVLQFATPNFDASVAEIFPTLAAGAALVLRDAVAAESVDGFMSRCADWGVTVAVPPTALWHEIVGALAEAGKAIPPALRLMCVGGERMLPERAALWRKVAPHTGLFNGYGPTETTVVVTRYLLPPGYDDAVGVVAIGRPLPNTRVYVFDRWGNLAPRGVPGELYVGGAQLADGYLGRPDLTAERFVPNPFAHGQRLYRTGDVVRWRGDGNLEYLGRLDRQVKVRGFRVEIGEVESALLESHAVRECAVEARESGTGDQRLVAYVVFHGGHDDASSALAELVEHLRRRLPGFMIPSTLVPLPALPRTSSDKIDRAALPPPALARREEEIVRPRTRAEHVLVEIWDRLLNVWPIGVEDDFFALGGHSLLAMRMVAEIRRAFGRSIALSTLFEGPTIARIAAHLPDAAEHEPVVRVVKVNPAGGRVPFIFFHPDALGGGLYCREIVRQLGPEQPIYLVGPAQDDALDTIEGVAAADADWIRKTVGGPYRIGGYCDGGLAAFEVARRLREQGETVQLVVLVESSGLNGIIRRWRRLVPLVSRLVARAGAGPGARARTARRLALHAWRWRAWWQRPAADRAATVLRVVRRTLRRGAGRGASGQDGVTPRPVDAVSAAVEAGAGASLSFVPRRYDGEIRLIQAVADDATRPAPRQGWGDVARVTIDRVRATHMGVLDSGAPGLIRGYLDQLDAPR